MALLHVERCSPCAAAKRSLSRPAIGIRALVISFDSGRQPSWVISTV